MIADGERAFRNALANRSRNFPGRGDPRSQDGMIFPSFTPGFSIAPGGSVFTIGSCFARNVERALLARGVEVPTAAFSAPPDEAPGQPNRILNQYNPATMLQCLRAAGRSADDIALYAASSGDGVIDPLLATGSRPVGRERALQRRGEINALYASGLEVSDTVVVTLGLVETWFDLEAGLYLNEAPQRRALAAHPGRWEFRRLGVGEAGDMVEDLVKALGAGRRQVVLTVSPVPLQVTFSGGDAVTANSYSKAVLRVVAEEVSRGTRGVDYFPSFETVGSAGVAAYGEDQVHVRPAVVDRIVGSMVDAYVGGDARQAVMSA